MYDKVISSTGEAPNVTSVHAIVFYDPKTGRIRHMHKAIALEGAHVAAGGSIEQQATRHAERMGVSLTGLKTLEVSDIPQVDGRYRVDLKTHKLVHVEVPKRLAAGGPLPR